MLTYITANLGGYAEEIQTTNMHDADDSRISQSVASNQGRRAHTVLGLWLHRSALCVVAHKYRMILAGMVGVGIGYAVLCVVPRTIVFSYAGTSCRSELTLLPGYQRSSAASYQVRYDQVLRVGSTSVISGQTCVTPTATPTVGTHKLAAAPWDFRLFQVNYRVKTPAQPALSMQTPAKPIPLSTSLQWSLSQPDTVFDYLIVAGEKTSNCEVKHRDITCPLNTLELTQGQAHDITITRQFNTEPPVALKTNPVTILPALHVVAASMAADQIVYEKPKSMTITFDKPLQSSRASLGVQDGEQIPITTTINESMLTITWANDLPREKRIILTLSSTLGRDGSTLEDSYQLAFNTSGGPKITGSTVAAAGVAANARIVISLDQAIAPGQDIAKFMRVSSVPAAVTYVQNQIIVQLNGAPACQSFNLALLPGLVGVNGVAGTAPWSMDSRIICGRSQVIGYSIQGKPLVAHYFGDGASTILFTGGIHGNEPSSTHLLNDLIAHLQKEAYKIPAGRQIVIVPNVNPDGIAVGQRYNMRNVNIDRNFPESDWVSDIVIRNNEVVVGGGGAAPLSEPEAKALATLTSQLRPRLMMSFHARGSLVGANDAADSRTIASAYARSVGYRPMFDNAEDVMGHAFTGEYEMWIAEAFNSAAVLVELPDYQGRYFSKHQRALWDIIRL